MTFIEILSFIFIDCFTTNLFFIVNYEIAVWAAQKLSDIEKFYILVSGYFGVVSASLCNYILGVSIYKIMLNYAGDNKSLLKNSNNLKLVLDKFYYYLILLSFIPVYSKFLLLFAGYSRSRAMAFIIGAPAIKVMYYGLSG